MRSLSRPPDLQHGGDEAARDGCGRRHPKDADRALIGLAKAQDHVDRGRLAGSVGAEQRGDLTDLEVKVDAVDRPHGAEAAVHVVQLDGGCGSLLAGHAKSLRRLLETLFERLGQPDVRAVTGQVSKRQRVAPCGSAVATPNAVVGAST